ncbi:MAG: O-antigen ligase family protein [Polyangiaceae bacterium]|nr:O-antigen ligase family protein [Polyangiaceae bacterium]
MSLGPGARAASGLALAAGAAILAWDPAAPAVAAKRAAVLVVGLVAAGLVAGGGGGAALAVPAGLATWGALVGWSALGLAWGPASGAAHLATLVGPAAVAVGVLALRRADRRRAIALLATAAGGALGTWGAIEGITGGDAPYGGQGNPNWLGLALAATLPIAAGAAVRAWHAARRGGAARRGHRVRVAVALGSVVAQALALVLSGSRTAWVAVVVAAGLVVAARRARAPGARAFRRVGGLAAAGAVLLLVVLAGAVEHAARPRSGAGGASAALDGRLHLWRVSLHAGAERLPLGTGPGGFGHAFLDTQARALASLDPVAAARRFENAETAHQAWLDAWVAHGAPGIALLAAAVALGALGLARARAWGPLGSLAAVGVASFGDSTLALPAVGVIVTCALAVARGPAVRVGARLAGGGLLVAAGLALVPAVAELRAERLRAHADTLEPGARLAALDAATRLAPRSGEASLAFGLALLEARQAAEAEAELERSTTLLANAGTWVAIGNARTLLGEPARARVAYQEGVRLAPGAFRARASLARAYVEAGELAAARRELAVARRLRGGHTSVPEIAELLRRAEVEADSGGVGESGR